MNRLVLLAVTTYGVALVALAVLNGPLLALTLPLLALLGAALLYGPEEPRLRITRAVDTQRILAQQEIAVTVTITNEGDDLELVEFREGLPAGVTPTDGETSLVGALAAGQSITLAYTAVAPRGRYIFRPIEVTAADFLLLFRRRVAVEAAGVNELYVLPHVPRVGRIPIRPRQTKSFAGYIPARIGGSGTEFFGVRGYQQGDPLRHINWRAMARNPGRFYTNEFEQERVADVGLILDARRRGYRLGEGTALFEYAIQATAALANAFLADANRVGLLRYGDFLDWTVAGYGKIQRERILQALARAEPGDSLVFEQMEHLPTRFFPPQSQIVLISPLLPGDADPLIRLRSRGYSLLVVSPNPITLERRQLPDSEATRLAARIAQVERALLFRKLRQAGIQVLDWDVSLRFEEGIGPALGGLRPLVGNNLPVGMAG